MSYNTRRSTGFPSGAQPQQQGAAAVGQRRPVVTNNFVPGGQLSGQQQQKQQQGQQQQQARTPHQQTAIQFRNQQQQQQSTPQQSYQTQGYSTTQQPQQQQQQQQVTKPPQQQQAPQQRQPPQEQKPVVQQQPQPSPVVPGANPPPPDSDMDTANPEESKKRWWAKRRQGKISKAERVKRRNVRLSKMIQPKNAVMILNELVKGCQYQVEELPVKVDINQFRASVTFEGQEFAGTGRTKMGAKNSAAEVALKYLVKNKQVVFKKESSEEEKMELGDEEASESGVMPWSQIASFAMYKLFTSWGEDPAIADKVNAQELLNAQPKPQVPQPSVKHEPRPAKKMPDNPEKMNPLMLMNQMLPNAEWEEVGRSGVPPNVVFTFNVTCDGQSFSGNGSSKKVAKKLAAFAACHQLLKVTYPPEVWVPLY